MNESKNNNKIYKINFYAEIKHYTYSQNRENCDIQYIYKKNMLKFNLCAELLKSLYL